ncbi:MAG: hypothetical protein Q4C74_07840 [Rothia sp. (in: high G+C Gram-positive bacteria)]|nr:hypothetical protein [Rothia sp. (in: high G+C Gram-positive bacteria)]
MSEARFSRVFALLVFVVTALATSYMAFRGGAGAASRLDLVVTSVFVLIISTVLALGAHSFTVYAFAVTAPEQEDVDQQEQLLDEAS